MSSASCCWFGVTQSSAEPKPKPGSGGPGLSAAGGVRFNKHTVSLWNSAEILTGTRTEAAEKQKYQTNHQTSFNHHLSQRSGLGTARFCSGTGFYRTHAGPCRGHFPGKDLQSFLLLVVDCHPDHHLPGVLQTQQRWTQRKRSVQEDKERKQVSN